MKVRVFLQKMKENWILSAVLTVLAGLVLTLFPGQTLKVISYVMGGAAVSLGIVRSVRYFRQDHTYPFLFQSDLIVGLLAVGFGLFLIASPEKVLSMVPFVFGVLLAGCGVGNILRALDAKKAGLPAWKALLALALISVAAGVLCMVNPFEVMETTVIVIGGSLIYTGVTDIATTLAVRKRIEAWRNADQAKSAGAERTKPKPGETEQTAPAEAAGGESGPEETA